ncbi:TfoX/Sxy family protein [Nocardioides litoris]|uniref:TfoX/Sxy family protein n=1 Tax=Nocardioides litoris TaxID=1926648 RepID=UPI0011225E52|nr:TfoX/Sxy family protein [Nocardioides litoris]
MTYDDALAARVRSLLGDLVDGSGGGPVEEERLFGGLGFLVAGHMPVCVSGRGEGLLVRVPEPDGEALVAASGDTGDVAWMAMGARTARTWVRVADRALVADDALASWVERGLAVVRGLPPRR